MGEDLVTEKSGACEMSCVPSAPSHASGACATWPTSHLTDLIADDRDPHVDTNVQIARVHLRLCELFELPLFVQLTVKELAVVVDELEDECQWVAVRAASPAFAPVAIAPTAIVLDE